MPRRGTAAWDKSNYLYYHKKAKRLGNEKLAAKWEKAYRDAGGTTASLNRSVQRMDPMAIIPKDLRGKFKRSLSPKEKEMLRKADAWYEEVFKGRRPASRIGAGR